MATPQLYAWALRGPYTTLGTNRADCKPMSMAIAYSWVLQMTHVDKGLICLMYIGQGGGAVRRFSMKRNQLGLQV